MLTVYVTNDLMLDNELCKFMPSLRTPFADDGGGVVGLEIKLSIVGKVPILALCVREHCVILQLLKFKKIPDSLYNFLAQTAITFVGFGIKDSVARLHRDYGIDCRNAIDLSNLAASVLQKPHLSGVGSAYISELVLKMDGPFVFTPIMNSWSSLILSKDQKLEIECCVFLSFAVGNKLFGGSYDQLFMEAWESIRCAHSHSNKAIIPGGKKLQF
ncbi:hypothetical protein ACHQM5_017854 [Ranunculus cassubicifolius]